MSVSTPAIDVHAVNRLWYAKRDSWWQVVQSTLAEVRHIPPEAVFEHLSLVEDLGIDSLDFLELGLKLEQRCRATLRLDYTQWLRAAGYNTDDGMTIEVRNGLLELLPDLNRNQVTTLNNIDDITELLKAGTLVRLLCIDLVLTHEHC